MAGSAEVSQVLLELILLPFHVSSICYSKASKASAFKDFSVMKVLIVFESLDTNTALRLRFEIENWCFR